MVSIDQSLNMASLDTASTNELRRILKALVVDIAAVKATMPKVLHDIASSALQVHGAIGVSTEMPFVGLIVRAYQMGLADGPTEVHKVTLARQLLREYEACADLFPDYHRPTAAAAAAEKFRAVLG